MACYPHITPPADQVHGLPVALSLYDDAYQEGKLIGYAFEQEVQARCPLAFQASVNP